MTEQEKMMHDILETVRFLRDHAASKEDVADVRRELKQDIAGLDSRMNTLDKRAISLDVKIDRVKDELEVKIDKAKDEMLNHIDGFAKLYQKHDTEFYALVAGYRDLEDKVNKIIKHLGLKIS